MNPELPNDAFVIHDSGLIRKLRAERDEARARLARTLEALRQAREALLIAKHTMAVGVTPGSLLSAASVAQHALRDIDALLASVGNEEETRG